MPAEVRTRQLVIVHLSDIHFGRKHSFSPPPAAEGDRPKEREYPTLLDKLASDLADEDPGCPVLIAVTGDMAQTGTTVSSKRLTNSSVVSRASHSLRGR